MLDYYITSQESKTFADSEKQTKFIAKLDEKALLTTDELCDRVSKRCTLSKYETQMAIMQVQEVMLQALSVGRGVQFGEMGVFHPKISAKLCTTKQEADRKSIDKVFCQFRQSRSLERFFKELKLRKITSRKTTEDNN